MIMSLMLYGFCFERSTIGGEVLDIAFLQTPKNKKLLNVLRITRVVSIKHGIRREVNF